MHLMELDSESWLKVLNSRNGLGASRLCIRQCFEPERMVTLIFKKSTIEIEVTGPRHSLIAGPGVDSQSRDSTEPDFENGHLAYDNAPEWIQSWDSFCSFCVPLPDCKNSVMDGTSYTHEIHTIDYGKAFTWINPSWLRNPLQMAVIRGYIELAEAAGLRRLIRMWHA